MWEDYDCDYQYYDREDDIYSGQYRDDEDEWADNPLDDYYESERLKEKQVKQEWIPLQESYDPFDKLDPPKLNQRILAWHSIDARAYFLTYYDQITPSRHWTHWRPEPEGPVKLLKFSEVIEGVKKGKRYRRLEWSKDMFSYPDCAQHSLPTSSILAEDWIEVG